MSHSKRCSIDLRQEKVMEESRAFVVPSGLQWTPKHGRERMSKLIRELDRTSVAKIEES